MNIIFNKLTLLNVGLAVVTALFVYSIIAIRRIGVITYFKAFSQVGKLVAATLFKLITGSLALLAESVKTSDANESLANAARGGVLNSRTGKLDDGTDPAGWYEKD